MSYLFLTFALMVGVLAMMAILYRLLAEYQRGSLSTKTLLVGGFIFAGLFGLFLAGSQVLVQGPGL